MDKIKQDDQVHVVSDGSFHPEMKMRIAAWVINSSRDNRCHLLGDNLTLGARETQ